MSTWPEPQLIETAPRDGSYVMAWCPFYQWEILRWIGAKGLWADCYNWKFNPTHWLPLPPNPITPPTEEEP